MVGVRAVLAAHVAALVNADALAAMEDLDGARGDAHIDFLANERVRIFLARYLHSLALRREIHEGLNTIERWNGANDFVYFARRGEMTSNRREDQEISMLSLHLLQNCMVYVNTLMLQEVLAQPHWQGRLTATDLRALTPLTWEHVNPYGRFELDMTTRLPLK